MKTKAMKPSGNADLETPDWLFRWIDQEFHFTLDVCANAKNHKVANYISPERDGLVQPWAGNVCWMNPPYTRGVLRAWLKRAYWAWSRKDCTVVALLPVAPDTSWWWGYVTTACEIRFLRGRLKFKGCRSPAPFASAVVVWYANCNPMRHRQSCPQHLYWDETCT